MASMLLHHQGNFLHTIKAIAVYRLHVLYVYIHICGCTDKSVIFFVMKVIIHLNN
jgi:hypothetical protein